VKHGADTDCINQLIRAHISQNLFPHVGHDLGIFTRYGITKSSQKCPMYHTPIVVTQLFDYIHRDFSSGNLSTPTEQNCMAGGSVETLINR
jgi:hypothetical protein